MARSLEAVGLELQGWAEDEPSIGWRRLQTTAETPGKRFEVRRKKPFDIDGVTGESVKSTSIL